MRLLLSALLWWAAAALVSAASRLHPAPLRRVLECDGAALIPEPKPRMLVETIYARRFSPEEAEDVSRRAVLGLREEAQA